MSTAATTEGGRRQGAAFEVVDDCRHDLAAWIDWLGSQGYSRIGLVGHSLGAVKSIYALTHEAHPSVACIVALSPPRLSYSHFCTSSDGQIFHDTYATAEQLVRAGQAGSLMEVKTPLPFVVTAGGYVEKYGPVEQYNILKFISKLPCPMLITFGSIELENNMAFRGLPEILAPISAAHVNMQVEVVPEADHFYTRVRAEVVQRVATWLECLHSQ